MNFRQQIDVVQAMHQSMLCVGLDPEPARFPLPWRDDPARIFDFCAAIVDATHDLVLAFKPQIAYFAAQRAEEQLERLIDHIHRVAPGVPVILDAKRGDIGATAEQYAREAFVRFRADAVTLSPFMGGDSLEPYMRFDGKGLILLCRTSNPGGSDLQAQALATQADGSDGGWLYEHIARQAAGPWNRGGQIGLVVGATFPREVARVRELAPTLPLLIPGIGAQGGDAAATVQAGWRPGGPIIVSSSRAILYAQAAAADIEAASRAARRVALDTRAVLQRAWLDHTKRVDLAVAQGRAGQGDAGDAGDPSHHEGHDGRHRHR